MTPQQRLRGDVAVLVPAAGLGVRLGPGGPKALRLLGGEPLLVHAVRRVLEAPSVGCVVVAAPADALVAVGEMLAPVVARARAARRGSGRSSGPAGFSGGPAGFNDLGRESDPAGFTGGPAGLDPLGPEAVAGFGPLGSEAAARFEVLGPEAVARFRPLGSEAGVVEAGGSAGLGTGPGQGVGPSGSDPSVAVQSPGDHVGQSAGPISRTDLRPTDEPGDVEVHVVAGGATRQLSVAAALAAVPDGYTVILVHDAARALTPAMLVERVAQAVRDGHGAVIPVLPVVDTIKQVDLSGAVLGTVDRSVLRAVQTPQGFRREVLVAAHAAAVDDLTDDAGLAEKLGYTVQTVPGDEAALKVTRPFDLAIAEHLLTLSANPDSAER